MKVLEAMALGTPVLTTSKGIEGLAVTPGRDILVADAPEEFASKTVGLLKDPGLQMPNWSGGSRQNEVPLIIYVHRAHPVKIEADGRGIPARRNQEVELEPGLIAVEDEIDTGPDVGVPDTREGRDTVTPAFRVGADEVVASNWQRLETLHPDAGHGGEFHPHQGPLRTL